jgi:hypothetical protein
MIIDMSKRMSPGPASHSHSQSRTKKRKTFTLSPESVAFLEKLSGSRADSHRRESVSAVLDDLLLAVVKDQERREIEDQIGKYYDQRSEEERREEIDWGKLATGEFVAIELNKSRG